MRAGGQLGAKGRAVLECLRKNTKLNRLDMERLINLGPLGSTIGGMMGMHYIKQHGGQIGLYEITRMGRGALGEEMALPSPTQVRICNGSMREPYVPDVHLSQRYGVSRI